MASQLSWRFVSYPFHEEIKKECSIRGVSFEVISITKAQSILDDISSPSQNMEAVVLEKAA